MQMDIYKLFCHVFTAINMFIVFYKEQDFI